jgi:hypothetical protein
MQSNSNLDFVNGYAHGHGYENLAAAESRSCHGEYRRRRSCIDGGGCGGRVGVSVGTRISGYCRRGSSRSGGSVRPS